MGNLPPIPTDLRVAPVASESKVSETKATVIREVKKRCTRIERLCEVALKQASQMVKYMTYDEMNLVFRMETYFERNKHIGIHWYRQLNRLIDKYRERWEADVKEYNLKKNLLD